MKKSLLQRSVLFFLLSLPIFFVTGCAGERPYVTDKKGRLDAPPKSAGPIKLENPEEEVFSDEQGKFRVVSTPGGLVKERVEKEEENSRKKVPVAKPLPIAARAAETRKVRPASKIEQPRPDPKSSDKPQNKMSTEGPDQKIVLNFDNANLYEVINTIAELLDMNYIVDSNVSGKVTIYTARGVLKKDLLSVFFQILEVNGLTAIKEGDLYKIITLKDAPRKMISIHDGEEVPPREKTIIQIIPLKFISAQEMTKLLTPFISAGGTIVSDANSNTLLVVDKGVNIIKMLRLVGTFDVNMFDKVYYRFYRLKYLDAEETAKVLDDFSSSYGTVGKVIVKFIAIARLDSLLAISTTPLVFDKIEEILNQLDVVVEESEPRIYVYFVRNGTAKDLAGLLDQVFPGSEKTSKVKTKSKAGGAARIPGNPLSQTRIREKDRQKASKKTQVQKVSPKATGVLKSGDKGAGTLRDDIRITPDEIRNALVIEAIPPDYKIIMDIVRRLDVLPRQVLIEATIAEITRDSSTDIGVNWALGHGAALGSATFAASVGGTGLKYSVGVTNKWYAELSALAKKGKVNVLSSPHVLASENKEAKIEISQEIPIATASTAYASATAVTTQTIQYRDTGIILSVTPHINEQGLVTMDISEEVSDVEKEPAKVAGVEYPAFFKRTINTTLTVKHGQTIAIGGLVRDKEDVSITGVPCLIDIPVFRYLFGQYGKSLQKVELIVLITPRVIVSLDDVDAVTLEFKEKVRNVMKRFNIE